jgi:hypothetical protein
MCRWCSTIRTSFRRRSSTTRKRCSSPFPIIRKVDNPARRFLLDSARSAKDASALVREAWSKYHSPVDYGITGLDLPKVVALIDAGMPARLYYTSYRNNAFDTHVFQNDVHKRLLTYASDAVSAFMTDLERIGRADDVVVMIFSEFGRRVPENVNLGTDHGTANLMFVAGKQVKGGQYGAIPSLTKLDAGDNLIHTTDFRRVYATMIDGWLGLARYEPAAAWGLRAVRSVSECVKSDLLTIRPVLRIYPAERDECESNGLWDWDCLAMCSLVWAQPDAQRTRR